MRFDNEVSISRNEIVMYIMWYKNIDLNTDSLEYHVSRTITKPTVQSNEYMILQGFEMHQITGRNNPVPKQRSNSSYQTTFEQWHDSEFGIRWKMDDATRQKALARCGQWH